MREVIRAVTVLATMMAAVHCFIMYGHSMLCGEDCYLYLLFGSLCMNLWAMVTLRWWKR